jgi:phospholipid N-methyltransferase
MSTTFLRSFLRRPSQVGAIAPSSKYLAAMMVDWFDWTRCRYVVEYGPGTGVFTKAILQSLHPDAKFFAIERSPELCNLLRGRYPQLDLCEDSVENVAALCQAREFPHVDAVICGLPWASFPDALQQSCLDALAKVLRPGGQFATFAYWQGLLLPAAHKFRRRLNDYFSEIESSPTVWRNLPPAFIYRCRR